MVRMKMRRHKFYLFGILGVAIFIVHFFLLPVDTAWAQRKAGRDVAALTEALKSPDRFVREDAARELERLGPEARAAIPALIEALNDEDIDVRRYAVSALGYIGQEANAAVPKLTGFLKDADPRIRSSAAYALGQMGLRAESAVPDLIAALKDSDSRVRRDAVTSLGRIYNLTTKGPEVRGVVLALIEALGDEDLEVRVSAASALGGIGPEARAGVPALVKLLNDPSEAVRIQAANVLASFAGLGELGSETRDATYSLVVLLKDKSPSMRSSAANAIGAIGPEARTAIPNLMALLKDENPEVRRAAAFALAMMRQEAKAAIPSLLSLLNDEEAQVNFGAISALGNIGREAKVAIPNLIELTKSSNPLLRRTAAGALASIARDISKSKDVDSIAQLKAMYKILAESQDQEVKKATDSVKQSIDSLESSWWVQLREWIGKHPYRTALVGFYPLLLLICLLLLRIRPLWLLSINETLSRNVESLPKKLGFFDVPLRYALVVGFFNFHHRVLDAWVNEHIDTAQDTFSRKLTVKERDVYIFAPVTLDGDAIPELKADVMRPCFSKELTYMLIWGEGGAGKTSLACLLAKWAMEKEERLHPEHLMLPVLIEQELESQIDGDAALLKLIGQQLRLLIDEENNIRTELLQHLLTSRRLLLIVDSFSEMSGSSRNHILAGISSIPVNACIVTSRTEETLGGLPKSIIRPLRIRGNKLATFMEAYLSKREKRELFDDEEFFEACRSLSSMVGEREITALIAKYYAEQMIAAKKDILSDNLPTNIPDLMLEYINIVNRNPPATAPDIEAIHRAAKIIAWRCLKTTYRPVSVSRGETVIAVGGEKDGLPLLKYLEDHLKIIKQVDFQQSIRYSMDPLSEYLAGLYLVEEYGANEESWRTFLKQSEEMEGYPDSVKGFLLAVRDCCLAKGTEKGVPEFVADELARRSGLNTENIHKGRTLRQVRQHMANLKSPYPEDRLEAAEKLRTMALQGMKQEAGAAVPVLVKALRETDYSIRKAVLLALGSIGAEAKSATPALIELMQEVGGEARLDTLGALRGIGIVEKASFPTLIQLLKHEDSNIRGAAIQLLKGTPGGVKAALPELIEILNGSEQQVNAARAIGSIGSEASAALPALHELLDAEDPIVRINAAVALLKIDPAATEAIPRIVECLRADESFVHCEAAIALREIDAAAKAAVPVLIELLKHPEPYRRRFAAETLEEIAPHAEAARPALVELLNDKDALVSASARVALKSIPQTSPSEELQKST